LTMLTFLEKVKQEKRKIRKKQQKDKFDAEIVRSSENIPPALVNTDFEFIDWEEFQREKEIKQIENNKRKG
jgi:hypothetical protein